MMNLSICILFCVSCSYVFLFRVSCILYDCMQDTTENQQYSVELCSWLNILMNINI